MQQIDAKFSEGVQVPVNEPQQTQGGQSIVAGVVSRA